jgi:ACS family D-galactonate transporter-like MFS transporter
VLVFVLQSRISSLTITRPRSAPVPAASDNPRLTPVFSRVLVLLSLSIFINYIDRSNLSIAAPLLKDELHISGTQLGTLLSAFFYTYSFCQLLAGWLVDRFDVKWVFALGFFLWSSATAVTGLLHTLALLLAARIVLGIGESVAYPSYSKIIAQHCPEGRRGFANSMISVGQTLGPSFGLLFGGSLVALYGWRPFFIGLGGLCLLWLVPWVWWMPASGPRAIAGHTRKGPGTAEILGQRSAWGTFLCLFCINYFQYSMVTWLPFYLQRERGFSLNRMARIGAGFFLVAALSASVSGWLADHWIAAGGTHTRVRKTFVAGGSAGIGIFLALSVLAPREASLVVLMFAGLAFGLTISNFWVITQRMAGAQAAGRWTGIENFIGNLAGIVAPTVTGILLDRTGHFLWPFLIVSALMFAGALSCLWIVGPIEPVDWQPRSTTAILQTSA